MRRRRGIVAALVVAAMATACGGGNAPGPVNAGAGKPEVPGASAPDSTAVTAGPPPAERTILPDVVVNDVRAGTKVNIKSLLPGRQPLLVWFWAPH